MTATVGADLDVEQIRADFPILEAGHAADTRWHTSTPGATSQKPLAVLDAERDFPAHLERRGAPWCASAHGGSEDAFENGRSDIAGFVGAAPDEVVFTKNAAEAHQPGVLRAGDSRFERAVGPRRRHRHHRTGASRQPHPVAGAGRDWHRGRPALVGVTDDGDRSGLAGPRRAVKVVAFTPFEYHRHGSPVRSWWPRRVGALTVLDACQSVPHQPVDLPSLGSISRRSPGQNARSHRNRRSTGRPGLFCRTAAVLTGGSMIETVTMDSATYAAPPQRFEAGTQMISGRRIGSGRKVSRESACQPSRPTSSGCCPPPWKGSRRYRQVRIIGPSDPGYGVAGGVRGRRSARPRRRSGSRRRGRGGAGRSLLRRAVAAARRRRPRCGRPSRVQHPR